ncbi:hypothetical protein Bca4012_103724 [Brassica carinata]
MIQAGIQAVQMVGQRFKNSTGLFDRGLWAAGRTRWRDDGRSGKLRGNQLLDGSISLSPYTQVRRTICTPDRYGLHQSFSLASPARHSSPSFGSRQACSHSTLLRRSRSVGCAPVRDPANQLPYALRVYSPVDSHTCQTPWSVFQDGSNGEPTGRRPEHADAEARREARAADHD